MRRLLALPRLAWGALRWKQLRGGWLADYLARPAFDPASLEEPIDVIVSLVDHFEPRRADGDERAADSVRSWCDDYRRAASKFVDADGVHPQHSWFYRSEYRNFGCIAELSQHVLDGFGEVEFHLHHAHDDHDSFTEKILSGLTWFQQSGAMLTAEAEPQGRFGYIAGNWSLDNGARDPAKGGCETELLVLRDAGCYADFTFPALGSKAQPQKVNSIYYATHHEGPKSYDVGIDMMAGRLGRGDLVIFEGPIAIDWHSGEYESAAVESFAKPSPKRMPLWLDAHVHVRNRPNWIFVKLHTHGMQSRDGLFDGSLAETWAAMTEQWNADPFRLHFATAREAYNIARAAEAGVSGSAGEYRDFVIPPPSNRVAACSGVWRMESHTRRRTSLRVLGDEPVTLRFAELDGVRCQGRIRHVVIERGDGAAAPSLRIDGIGAIEVATKAGTRTLEAPFSLNALELAS